MKARVFVTLKPSVFDPQGNTITEALHDGLRRRSTTCGRASTSSWSGGDRCDAARAVASEVAHKLLANPVIESYRIEVD